MKEDNWQLNKNCNKIFMPAEWILADNMHRKEIKKHLWIIIYMKVLSNKLVQNSKKRIEQHDATNKVKNCNVCW